MDVSLEGKITLTVYLDAVFLINLICNAMIILLTAKLIKSRISLIRLIMSSIIASLIIPFIVFFPTSFINTIPVKLLYSILIILFTFGWKTRFQLLKNLFMFYFISIVMGGGLLAIQFISTDAINITNQTSLGFMIMAFPIVWIFTKNQMDNHVMDKIKCDQMYDVTIKINEKSINTIGYMDSGNQLVDPLTNRPVIICDEAYLIQFFTNQDWEIIRNIITQNNHNEALESLSTRLYIIPYKAVGVTNNYLYAIKPQNVSITYENEIIETNQVFVGIQLADLSNDETYHCLLHPKIIHHAVVMTA